MARIVDRVLELIDRAVCADCAERWPEHGVNTDEEMNVDGDDLSDP